MRRFAWLLALAACTGEPEATTPDVCDAGDEAWVQRAMPLLWGRHPHGAAEVRMWANLAHDAGRDTAVSAMTRSPEFRAKWREWLMDALFVARSGDKDYRSCFGDPMLAGDDGALARFLAASAPGDAPYAEPFTMADVLDSALQADDLSVAYRVHLFARIGRPLQGANVGPYELEDNRRTNFGETFLHSYLNRNLTCLSCHNSESSVTGSDDPLLDRTWEIPGRFEEALWGDSTGLPENEAFAIFRYEDLAYGGVAPWGMSPACGTVAPKDSLTADYLGRTSFFIEDHGEVGSAWDLESYLREGVDRLGDGGLVVAADGTMDGADAFAYLVGASVADQVWKEATGARLTIANYFPRNHAQRDRLRALTDAFVESHFSLRTLLVAVTTDPLFAAGSPETCESRPYGLDPVVDPWTVHDPDPARWGNSTGDLVHRHPARTLIRSVNDAMGWEQPPAFLREGSETQTLETALGAFLRESQPGFNGTDFQGLLAYEAAFGACEPPTGTGASDGCTPTPGDPGCDACACEECTCADDPYCCEVQWDAACVAVCNDDCGGCGEDESGGDTVDQLVAKAVTAGATHRDLAEALKDRLTAHGAIDADEESIVESLLGNDLDAPVTAASEPGARALCGALLESPDFLLAVDVGDAGVVPKLALSSDDDCANLVALAATQDIVLTCVDGVPQ